MRILHAYKIYLPDIHGGIPAVIRCLVRVTRSSSEIIVARRLGWTGQHIVDATVVTATMSLGTLFSMPIAPTFPRALLKRSDHADILVHHAPFPLTDLAIAIGLPERTGLIVYWHAEIVGRSLLRLLVSPLIRYTLNRADKIVVSDDSIVHASSFLKPHRSKIAVVPYGVDTEYWIDIDDNQKLEISRRRTALPRLVVAIGRLVSYKGFDILLRAIAKIDSQAIIIGGGPLLVELEALAVTLGVADRVKFVGNIATQEIKIWMHAARVFALPSRTIAEAFGIVQIEAMSAGLPIVNTNLPSAVPHIARDGMEGLTVSPDNPAELAAALERLLDDPELAKRLGAAARVRARTEYGESAFLERISTIYEEVSKSRSAGLPVSRCG
jgi:rhamnosyl/mannosyltransferase